MWGALFWLPQGPGAPCSASHDSSCDDYRAMGWNVKDHRNQFSILTFSPLHIAPSLGSRTYIGLSRCHCPLSRHCVCLTQRLCLEVSVSTCAGKRSCVAGYDLRDMARLPFLMTVVPEAPLFRNNPPGLLVIVASGSLCKLANSSWKVKAPIKATDRSLLKMAS